MTFLAWEYGDRPRGARPSLPAWTENAKRKKRGRGEEGGAWESVNKLEREKGEVGGLIQGDRSVNHQRLRFILPPLSKTFKGGFVYLLPQTGAGNLGNRKPSAPPSPPLLLSYTSPVPLPLRTHPPSSPPTHTHTQHSPLFYALSSAPAPLNSPPSARSYLVP